MKKFLFISSFLIIFPLFVSGSGCGSLLSEDGSQEGVCEHAHIDANDKASLQRGAKLYMNYCYGCHSLKYARYKRVADDLEIPYDIFESNLMFGDAKIGDLMNIGMQDKDAKVWFGESPPDLTLEVALRGPDWVYSYLKSFYSDSSRPLGTNNKVYENVGMPNVLIEAGKENAGAVNIGDGYSIVMKIESHNHPSAVEPKQGAATGVGGIVRDIMAMGAYPIALLNSLRFGPIDKKINQYLL